MAKQLRGHPPIEISRFGGLWRRGDVDVTPLDHFTDADNILDADGTSIFTRPGIGISQGVATPLENVKRIYNYNTGDANTLLVLTNEQGFEDIIGNIYHVVDATTVYGPILVVQGMEDFAFAPYGGRAYISPFRKSLPVLAPPVVAPTLTLAAGAGVENGVHQYAVTFVNAEGETIPSDTSQITVTAGNNQVNLTNIITGGTGVTARNVYRTVAAGSALLFLTTIPNNTTTIFTDNTPDASLGAPAPSTNTAISGPVAVEKGLENEVVYVYAGNGTNARAAAGSPLTGNMTIANGAAGNTDPGIHIFGFVVETISGFLSAPGLLETFTTTANLSVSFGSIPTSGDPNVIARHLVASKAIPSFNGNLEGYDLFFVPGGTIPNNTDTFLNNVSFFDQDLLDDASHLLDNYEEIPAVAHLSLYNERLVAATTFDNINLALVSARGEPESISEISGILTVQPDGNPITNGQELRDVFYLFKRTRAVAYVDNGDEPSSWEPTIIDNALGTCVHGIATVLDSGSSSVDFLIICTFQGVSLFNGKFITPELTFKVEHFWGEIDRDLYGKIQIVMSPSRKLIYIVLPDKNMIVGNFDNGLDAKNISWWPWSFRMGVNTIAIVDVDEIIVGADFA
jgi:hypothetical protein